MCPNGTKIFAPNAIKSKLSVKSENNCSVQGKVLKMLGHMADQEQVWLDNFEFNFDTYLISCSKWSDIAS